jgi:hypothetical protein
MLPWYCTREDVTDSLEIKYFPRAYPLIDRKIAGASRSVEGQLNIPRFAPTLMTVKFDWPNNSYAPAWTLELDSNYIISLTECLAGGNDITSSCILRRGDDTDIPPFNRIEIDLSGSSGFSSGTTFQQAIHVTGLFGHSNDEETIGELAADLAATNGATAEITWNTPRLGVGDILRIDNERVIVTERAWVDSGQTITGALTASKSNVAIPVSNGAAFAAGEVIIIDVERMLIIDVIGNNLSVERAAGGSVLATHLTSTPVYALTGVQLARGQLGTTIAAHTSGADIQRWVTPAALREFSKAQAIVDLEQDTAAWARTVGSGATLRESSGKGLADAREQAMLVYGRKYRSAAI